MTNKRIAVKQRQFNDSISIDGPSKTSSSDIQELSESIHHAIPLQNGRLVRLRRKTTIIKPEKVLDGFLLIETSGFGLPDDVRKINLCGKGLIGVNNDDLSYFNGLVYLDVSENRLELNHLVSLPRLKELILTCNLIRSIPPLPSPDAFERLQRLDISYNLLKLDAMSIAELQHIPNLVDLDLCGNSLTVLPDLSPFMKLERLHLAYNNFSDDKVFLAIANIPRLRYVTLAHNSLVAVPRDVSIRSTCFRLLDYLDVSFNFFGRDEDVRPLLYLPRLLTLLMYGNPLLGPTGEDPLHAYIEDLEEEAHGIRDACGSKLLEIVTEVPRKRSSLAQAMSTRHAMYKNFALTAAVPLSRSAAKPAYAWRQEGRSALLSAAEADAREHEEETLGRNSGASVNNSHSATTVFLTEANLISSPGKPTIKPGMSDRPREIQLEPFARSLLDSLASVESAKGADALLRLAEVAHAPEKVITRITTSAMSAVPTSSIPVGAHLSSAFGLTRPSALSGVLSYSSSPDKQQQQQVTGQRLQETDPPDATQSTIAFRGHAINVQTAVRALRYTLKHPLTSDEEVPGPGFLPTQGYAQATESSEKAQLRRKTHDGLSKMQVPPADVFKAGMVVTARPGPSPIRKVSPGGRRTSGSPLHFTSSGGGGGFMDDIDFSKISAKNRGFKETREAKEGRDARLKQSIKQIEMVLDGLNAHTAQLAML